MVEDARQRQKTWLDTYITDSNLTKDDDTTEVSWISCFEEPQYSLERVFYGTKNVDLLYTIGTPTSSPLVDWDGTIYDYEEAVPIYVQCVTKQGITGNKLKWKADAELRLVAETYPLGSYRSISRAEPYDQNIGSWKIYGIKVTLTYSRDTT